MSRQEAQTTSPSAGMYVEDRSGGKTKLPFGGVFKEKAENLRASSNRMYILQGTEEAGEGKWSLGLLQAIWGPQNDQMRIRGAGNQGIRKWQGGRHGACGDFQVKVHWQPHHGCAARRYER